MAATPEDREYIKQLLFRVEQSIHRHGWDQPPFIGTVGFLRPNMLSLNRIDMQIKNPPRVFLEWLAGVHLMDPAVPQAMLDQHPGTFYGVVFVCEGWTKRGGVTSEQARKMQRENTSMADLPDAEEVRMIIAVDIWGRTYSIHRIRGDKPMMHEDNPNASVAGGVAEALRQIVLSVVQILPDHKEQETALNTLFIPNMEDLVVADQANTDRLFAEMTREGDQQ